MSNTQSEITIPSYITVTETGVTVKLKKAVEANGVKVDVLTLREPKVKELRAAKLAGGGDAEREEMALFSSLAEIGVSDLDNMGSINYGRLQEGYFCVVTDDGV